MFDGIRSESSAISGCEAGHSYPNSLAKEDMIDIEILLASLSAMESAGLLCPFPAFASAPPPVIGFCQLVQERLHLFATFRSALTERLGQRVTLRQERLSPFTIFRTTID